jgi:hypothetical protein
MRALTERVQPQTRHPERSVAQSKDLPICLHHLNGPTRLTRAALCCSGQSQVSVKRVVKFYSSHRGGRSFDCVARKVPRATSLRMTILLHAPTVHCLITKGAGMKALHPKTLHLRERGDLLLCGRDGFGGFLRTSAYAFGAHDLDVRDTDEAENLLQILLLKIGMVVVGTFAVQTAA